MAQKGIARQQDERGAMEASFWLFTHSLMELSGAARQKRLQEGLSASLFLAVAATFQLNDNQVAILINASTPRFGRRSGDREKRERRVAERLGRIAALSHFALAVFEDERAATDWLSRPNESLGGQVPVMLCETHEGSREVRRVLHAMEWGGVA
ncbi:antitoxin Xre/MbcA/ParS toxin-binding domain-containing protein [Vreelandella rituensis]|uniref:DUF2384 domain-containing protein n=1 Tax=Vreelandella rituensis TaxID=2282306 RepID=A0A368UBG0_9GAMM|nr:antitoxin Xre/MbcA/ParS toxin-binding domain-containing protein [Halomonas rituensis]RCV93672.1 DUF2384 domain-containing protein [Halomonas rituensis]